MRTRRPTGVRPAVRFGRPAPGGAAVRARFAAARLLRHLRAFTPRFRKPNRNGLLRIRDLLAAAAALQLPALHLVHLFAYFFAGPRTVLPASRRPMRGRTFSGCHRTFSLHRIGKRRGMRRLRESRAELPRISPAGTRNSTAVHAAGNITLYNMNGARYQ